MEGTAGFALLRGNAKFTIFWATSLGNIWLGGSHINARVPEVQRRRLLTCLRSAGLDVVEEQVLLNGRWPSFEPSRLTDDELRQEFKQTMVEISANVDGGFANKGRDPEDLDGSS